jgi:hypothetical protein
MSYQLTGGRPISIRNHICPQETIVLALCHPSLLFFVGAYRSEKILVSVVSSRSIEYRSQVCDVMSARRPLLASVFAFGFCLTTGCVLSRGTSARPFKHTIPADQTGLFKIFPKQPNVSSEEARADGFVRTTSSTGTNLIRSIGCFFCHRAEKRKPATNRLASH